MASTTLTGTRASTSGASALVRIKRLFPVVSANELLLGGTTIFLVAFGLVMVLSSSSVQSYASSGSFFGDFLRQGMFAFVGIPLMLVAARMSRAFWRRIAWAALLVGLVLQVLVFTPLGFASGGNRNWLELGPISLQPSEFVKLALIVWLGVVLERKERLITRFWHAWIPVLPVAGIALGLVLLGHDFGTVVIMAALVIGAMWFAGVRLWHLLGPTLLVVLAAVPIILSSDSRVSRIQSFFAGCTEADYYDGCWQQLHGTWALANGGLFGVGLGNSRAKWQWLPAADNDYIFAIVGEELGLVGATIVLLLFVVLAFALLRIIGQAKDQLTRVVTGAVLVWIVGQAIVNVAVVLGLLPVLGVPLPFISSGGSQMIASLVAIGVVLSLARRDPGVRKTGR